MRVKMTQKSHSPEAIKILVNNAIPSLSRHLLENILQRIKSANLSL